MEKITEAIKRYYFPLLSSEEKDNAIHALHEIAKHEHWIIGKPEKPTPCHLALKKGSRIDFSGTTNGEAKWLKSDDIFAYKIDERGYVPTRVLGVEKETKMSACCDAEMRIDLSEIEHIKNGGVLVAPICVGKNVYYTKIYLNR